MCEFGFCGVTFLEFCCMEWRLGLLLYGIASFRDVGLSENIENILDG